MEPIINHSTLINALGGNKEVARRSGDNWKPVTVGQWKAQGRIPPEYWPRFIEMAAEQEIPGINSNWLMRTWPTRKNITGSSAQAEAGVPA